jgi:hypothetical protein
MSAGRYDIEGYQGATLSRIFTWKDENDSPIDLSGYTARMEIRSGSWPTNQIKPSGSDGVPALDADSYLTLGGNTGIITLSIPAVPTMTALAAGNYVYDLELELGSGNAAVVTVLLEGSFTVLPNITRA